MTEQNITDTSLQIVKEFSASVEKVYAAWTDPKQMMKWMGPGEVKCENVQIDLKVGGNYSIEMVTDECEHPNAIGEYKEIVPNKRLQFTWSWKGGDMPDTLVTIDFEDMGGTTKLTLVHENFSTPEAAEKHNIGWDGCLENLNRFFS